MDICVIGTGYVGLVAGTCFAEMGNSVICVDKDENKIKSLEKGIIPIYEPGLEELIISSVREGRLVFTTSLAEAVQKSKICFIAVGTPQKDDGDADMSAVFSVARDVAKNIKGYTIIVNKSTSPVGTCEKIAKIVEENTDSPFDIVSNPEFLKQGDAVNDFLKPDRVVIGADSEKAKETMLELYAQFVRTGNPVLTMDTKSAEMTKYAANSFLATKISFINEIANLCEKIGADVEMVRRGMTSDRRIGTQFLFPGLGYGGSCFPKDVKALIKKGEQSDFSCDILKAVDKTNFKQREIFIQKILDRFNNDVKGKVFGMWGLAFKPKTNDTREAPSFTIIEELLKRGAEIHTYDPKAFEKTKEKFANKISYCENALKAAEDADALLIVTEWNEFREIDFGKLKSVLKNPIIFDGRNIFEPKKLQKFGIEYYYAGKK